MLVVLPVISVCAALQAMIADSFDFVSSTTVTGRHDRPHHVAQIVPSAQSASRMA
jgi:hypothetical protein